MVTDQETNTVFLSKLLASKCPDFYYQLTSWLTRFEIKYKELSGTKDLWVRDYMPLQVHKDYFLQYKYEPDYLKFKKYQSTKTEPSVVCQTIGLVPDQASIVLDGGNVVKHSKKVILTSKVFKDNPDFTEHGLVNEIKNQLQVQQVIVIPQEPGDFVGHSDGMVRFINEETVLINQYPQDNKYKEFGYNFRWSLQNAGLDYLELPYDSWKNKSANDATGCYINYLETGNYIFFPVYGNYSDQLAEIQLQHAFPGRQLVSINCSELAKLGGVLNCVSWNILI